MHLQHRYPQSRRRATLPVNTVGQGGIVTALCLSISMIGCALLLAGCGPVLIAMDQPAPYSHSLTALLDEPWADRAAVHDWLGEPPITRGLGRFEIYVAMEEVYRSYPRLSDSDNVYKYHYLVIEYGADDRIRHHNEIVNAGCTTSGVCLFDRRCLGYPVCPESITGTYQYVQQVHVFSGSAQQLLAERIDQTVIYSTAAEDQRAKSRLPDPESCLFRFDRAPASAMVKITLPGATAIQLPADGFLTWTADPGEYAITVEWSDWKFEYASRSITLSCTAGTTPYFRIDLVKTQTLGWRYDMNIVEQPPAIGEEAINEKWLVLQ